MFRINSVTDCCWHTSLICQVRNSVGEMIERANGEIVVFDAFLFFRFSNILHSFSALSVRFLTKRFIGEYDQTAGTVFFAQIFAPFHNKK